MSVTDRERLEEIDALKARIAELNTECQHSMREIARERTRADAAEAQVETLREALVGAKQSLKPFSDCVFDDNGDMTVSNTYLCQDDDFCAARIAYRHVCDALAATKHKSSSDLAERARIAERERDALLVQVEMLRNALRVLLASLDKVEMRGRVSVWAGFRKATEDARAALAATEPKASDHD